jgi:hypothetical protein
VAKTETMSKQHTDRELGIFHKFAEISGLDIDRSSVRKLDPPAPDIFCRTNSNEEISFELGELIDENFASGMSRYFEGKNLLQCMYEKLSSQKKEQFDMLYHNADIQFGFCDDATIKKLKQKLPMAFDELLEQPEYFQDELSTFSDPELVKVLRFIRVSRGIVGPLFDVENYMRMGDPTLNALNSKFQKKYSSHCPIELLAYIDRNLMFPDNVWKPGVEQLIQGRASLGCFRKMWIVDVYKKIIHFEVTAA